jgi:hypothetical protein
VSLPEWKYQPQYQTHADCTEDDLVTMLKDHCVNIQAGTRLISCALCPDVRRSGLKRIPDV